MVNLVAYCDASHDKKTNEATACTIILSDLMFHGMYTGIFENVETGSRAELLGMIQTVKMIKEIDNVGTITIYCDSQSTINVYSKILKEQYVRTYLSYYDDWCELFELSKGMSVLPVHIKGHSNGHNVNKLCDNIANYTLKLVTS